LEHRCRGTKAADAIRYRPGIGAKPKQTASTRAEQLPSDGMGERMPTADRFNVNPFTTHAYNNIARLAAFRLYLQIRALRQDVVTFH